MFVIHPLRLNKFESQPVPSARAIFQRFAKSFSESSPECSTGSKATSDCISDAGLQNLDKLQTLHLADMLIQKSEQFKSDPDGTKSLDLSERDL